MGTEKSDPYQNFREFVTETHNLRASNQVALEKKLADQKSELEDSIVEAGIPL